LQERREVAWAEDAGGQGALGAERPQARHAGREYVVLRDEDAAAFHALETTLLDELAPVGALEIVRARRFAVAA
jgi:hypothetical protein